MAEQEKKLIVSSATDIETDVNAASVEAVQVETAEEIKTNPFILNASAGYSTTNDPSSKPWQPNVTANIGYLGCLRKNDLKNKTRNIDGYFNLNVNAGTEVQEAKLTYFGLAGAKENSKGQIFGGGFGLNLTGIHRNKPFVDYDKTIRNVQEGDKEFTETGKHCNKIYEIDVDNKWSVGAGIDAFAFQKFCTVDLKQTVGFEYRENCGLGKDAIVPFTGRGNETPEGYVMNRVPEGVNVVKGLSPFNTMIECSAEWKPVKNFRNLSFGAKAGLHLNGVNPYPIVGGYVKVSL